MATNFSIPYVFVVPNGNSLPSDGTHSSALTLDQFGIFTNGQVAVSHAGSTLASAAKFLQLFQGTSGLKPGGNLRSDRIYASNLTEFYKVPARSSNQQQITTITGLSIKPGEELTVAFRIHSNLIDNAFYNGMLKSIVVLADCPDCGGDPCAELDGTGYDNFYQSITDKINNHTELKKYLSAAKGGSGSSSTVTITGIEQTSPFPNQANDPFQNVATYDRLWFHTYIGKAPDSIQDFVWIEDRCDVPGTITVTQRATYKTGTAAEVKLALLNMYSYLMPNFKEVFGDNDYNPYFAHLNGLVTQSAYDLYYMEYFTDDKAANDQTVRLKESAHLYIPNGSTTAIEQLLTDNFGTIGTKITSGNISYSPLTPQ